MTASTNSANNDRAKLLWSAANSPSLSREEKNRLRDEACRHATAAIVDLTNQPKPTMNRSSFPLLVDLARAMRSSASASFDLTPEQRDVQSDLVRQARQCCDVPAGCTGLILPWREGRAMSVTGETSVAGDQGGMVVGTSVPEIGLALRDKLVLAQLGSNLLFNLRGNLQMTREKAGISVEWTSENSAPSAAGAPSLGMLSLSPHRVSAFFDVTDELLMQGYAIEPFVRAALMAALAEAIQQVVVNGSGGNNQPLGILKTPGVGSVSTVGGSAATYADVCLLEETVTSAKADRGNLGWLTSPKVRKALRNTFVQAAGTGQPIWRTDQADQLLGYPAGVTTSVPNTLGTGAQSALIFGEWSECFVALWGPGVLIDAVPVVTGTDGMKGLVRLIARAYVDGGVRIPEAFAAKQDCIVS
jgi:HK97 family phage major capsid protein